jgi:glutamyl-tRNA synthetase
MGAEVPVYGHLPLINGPDGAKLSKRHGALAVEAYRDMGYLPETMRNYLLRLGWSHGDDEIISTEQAIAWFNFEAIGKSAARMDYKKLDNLNGHYIRQSPDDALTRTMVTFLAQLTPPQTLSETARARLAAAMPSLKERARTLVELNQSAEFLYTDGPRALDEAAAGLLGPEGRAALAAALPALEATDWTGPALEAAARAHAEAAGLKLGQVAQPMRAALTGKASSPPVFEMLALLGRAESLNRLRAYASS